MSEGWNHVDLGSLEGPVLIFGGPYSNLQATQALLAEAARRGVAPNALICSGDVVAYGADAPATVAAIRASGCGVVAGNCERQLAIKADTCGCGFAAGSACDLLAAGWYAHADSTLGADDRAWMARCPDIVTFVQAGQRCAVIHGGLSDISRFLWPSSPKDEFQKEIALISKAVGPVDLIFAGHCGMAFARCIGDVIWINAGVIGLPPHDGRTETRFVTLREGKPTIQRLHYDHPGARRAMEQAGLTQGYHQTISSGIWPSQDVLPKSLRRA